MKIRKNHVICLILAIVMLLSFAAPVLAADGAAAVEEEGYGLAIGYTYGNGTAQVSFIRAGGAEPVTMDVAPDEGEAGVQDQSGASAGSRGFSASFDGSGELPYGQLIRYEITGGGVRVYPIAERGADAQQIGEPYVYLQPKIVIGDGVYVIDKSTSVFYFDSAKQFDGVSNPVSSSVDNASGNATMGVDAGVSVEYLVREGTTNVLDAVLVHERNTAFDGNQKYFFHVGNTLTPASGNDGLWTLSAFDPAAGEMAEYTVDADAKAKLEDPDSGMGLYRYISGADGTAIYVDRLGEEHGLLHIAQPNLMKNGAPTTAADAADRIVTSFDGRSIGIGNPATHATMCGGNVKMYKFDPAAGSIAEEKLPEGDRALERDTLYEIISFVTDRRGSATILFYRELEKPEGYAAVHDDSYDDTLGLPYALAVDYGYAGGAAQVSLMTATDPAPVTYSIVPDEGETAVADQSSASGSARAFSATFDGTGEKSYGQLVQYALTDGGVRVYPVAERGENGRYVGVRYVYQQPEMTISDDAAGENGSAVFVIDKETPVFYFDTGKAYDGADNPVVATVNRIQCNATMGLDAGVAVEYLVREGTTNVIDALLIHTRHTDGENTKQKYFFHVGGALTPVEGSDGLWTVTAFDCTSSVRAMAEFTVDADAKERLEAPDTGLGLYRYVLSADGVAIYVAKVNENYGLLEIPQPDLQKDGEYTSVTDAPEWIITSYDNRVIATGDPADNALMGPNVSGGAHDGPMYKFDPGSEDLLIQERLPEFLNAENENKLYGIIGVIMDNRGSASMVFYRELILDRSETAKVSAQDLYVNGKRIICDKYNVGDENYFKLRDLAVMLNGTPYQFSIGYDEATHVVEITTGEAYGALGTEMGAGEDRSATCELSAWTLKVDGKKVSATVYNLGGNNYFRLRDLGDAIGFGVKYDPILNAAVVTAAEDILLIHVTDREVGIDEAYFDEYFAEGTAKEGIETILNAGQYYVNGLALPATEDETDCYYINGYPGIFKTETGWGWRIHKAASSDSTLTFEEARLGFAAYASKMRGHTTALYTDGSGYVARIESINLESTLVHEIVTEGDYTYFKRGNFELEADVAAICPEVDTIAFPTANVDPSIKVGDIILYWYGPDGWTARPANALENVTMARAANARFLLTDESGYTDARLESHSPKWCLFEANRPGQFTSGQTNFGLGEIPLTVWCTDTGAPIGFTRTQENGKTALGIAIETAKTAMEGVASGDGLEELKSAIAEAEAVYADETAEGFTCDETIYYLSQAYSTFKSGQNFTYDK